MTTPASRVLTALLLAGAVVASATACGGAQPAEPSSSAGATASPTPGGSTSAPSAGATPIDIDCTTLLTPEALYEINPNYSANAEYSPAAGGTARDQVGDGGLACGWINQTSGSTLEVSVSNPGEGRATELKDAFAADSTAVPAFGTPPVEGFFEMNGAVGEAQVFSGPYWLTAVSTDFVEAGDAAPVVEAALAALEQ
jgi:hypothetical protein